MDDYLSKPLKMEDLEASLMLAGPQPPELAPDTESGEVRVHQLLDVAQLEVIRGLQEDGQPDLISELAAIYAEQVAACMDELRKAFTAADAKTIARAAHGLKGVSANLGARRARAGSLDGLDLLFMHLSDEVAKAQRALAAYQRDPKAFAT